MLSICALDKKNRNKSSLPYALCQTFSVLYNNQYFYIYQLKTPASHYSLSERLAALR